MIILRYLTKEVLQTTLAVTGVLLLIIMSGRFVKYLAEAALGKLDVAVLFAIMFYRLPGFLELILPLGFFVALLLAYGRLYTDNEMTVLFACGISRGRLLRWTYISSLFVALLVAVLSLWLAPLGLMQVEKIIAKQQARSEFETIQAGSFQYFSDQTIVSYAADVDSEQGVKGFFLADAMTPLGQQLTAVNAHQAAYEQINGQRYLVLHDGIRYEGKPGQADYRITSFQAFAQQANPSSAVMVSSGKVARLSTADLWHLPTPAHQAVLQWRLSSPLIVLVVTLLGLVFSVTQPRKGRYVMLFPAIVIYLLYLTALNSARGAMEAGQWPQSVGLWGVHGAFFVGATLLLLVRFFHKVPRLSVR